MHLVNILNRYTVTTVRLEFTICYNSFKCYKSTMFSSELLANNSHTNLIYGVEGKDISTSYSCTHGLSKNYVKVLFFNLAQIV